MNIINHLDMHMPPMLILLNVAGLLNVRLAEQFGEIMANLRFIANSDGRSRYLVSHRLLHTCHWGLPHHRKRVYIVGLRSDAINATAPFFWRGQHGQASKTHIASLMDDVRQVNAT